MKLTKEQTAALTSKIYKERNSELEVKKQEFIKRYKFNNEELIVEKLYSEKEELNNKLEIVENRLRKIRDKYNFTYYNEPRDFSEFKEKIIELRLNENFQLSKQDIENEILILTIDSKDLDELLLKLK
jgi:cyclopropane fatty-acyl-phospholipid synthase-like methyltransferase